MQHATANILCCAFGAGPAYCQEHCRAASLHAPEQACTTGCSEPGACPFVDAVPTRSIHGPRCGCTDWHGALTTRSAACSSSVWPRPSGGVQGDVVARRAKYEARWASFLTHKLPGITPDQVPWLGETAADVEVITFPRIWLSQWAIVSCQASSRKLPWSHACKGPEVEAQDCQDVGCLLETFSGTGSAFAALSTLVAAVQITGSTPKAS